MDRRVVGRGEFGGTFVQGGLDRGFEGGAGGKRAVREAVVLEGVPLRLDAVQFRAVRRQVIEGDADGLEGGQGGFDGLTVVDAVVVQRDGAGALPAVGGGHRVQGRSATGQADDLAAHEVEQGVPVQLARARHARQAALVDEAGLGPERGQRAEHVHPAALGRLVAQQRAHALARPGVVRGHGRREPALIQVVEVVRAPRGRLRQSVNAARSAFARAWRSGSALCWTLRLVRFQRYLRWRKRSPRYLGETATWYVLAIGGGPPPPKSTRHLSESA